MEFVTLKISLLKISRNFDFSLSSQGEQVLIIITFLSSFFSSEIIKRSLLFVSLMSSFLILLLKRVRSPLLLLDPEA